MKVIYTGEEAPSFFSKSLFLAGPTSRLPAVPSWRPGALNILEERGYDGVVFVPEDRDGSVRSSYDDQVEWEHHCLDMCDCILFWMPRDLDKMPAFTTNIEFGLYAKSGKSVFGAPSESPKNGYLRHCAKKFKIPEANTLEETISFALKLIGQGARREGGERFVPLQVWNTPSFQSWYRAQTLAGNRLDGAQLLWVWRVGPEKEFIYSWVLHADVHVTGEGRNKTNEIVIARPDISAVALYRRDAEPLETRVVLVREFRSPGRTRDGFVHDLPGGSSFHAADSKDVAMEEVREETGLHLARERLREHFARQLAGTFSAHSARLFSYELNEFEMYYLESQKNVARGANLDNPTGERCYLEVKTLGEIMRDNLVDWSVLGMILSVVTNN